MIRNRSKQNGFSLIEVLVALTILLVVIAGSMTVAVESSRSTSFATEQTAAFFLAQEGVELAQNARDNYYLGSFDNLDDTWEDFRDDYDVCFTDGCGLFMDGSDDTVSIIECDDAADCQLYYENSDSIRSRLAYNDDASSILYARRIEMEAYDADGNGTEEQVRIVSQVTWQSGSLAARQEVQVETYLFDVYDTES